MPKEILPEIGSFLDYLKFEKRYSVHTIISYETDLKDFFHYIRKQFDNTLLNEINHNLVRSWLADLKENGISSRSINRKISTLKSFFKFQLKTGVIHHTPMNKVIAPKINKPLPAFITEEDAGRLISSLKNTDNWKQLNVKMLIILFYTTGLRLSELINLREQHIDLNKLRLKVLGKGNKERIIPINYEIVSLIKDYQELKKKEFETVNEYLLLTEKGMKMYPKYAYLLVKMYLREEVKTLTKKSPHVLRHSFATHLANNGANLNAIKELLGHSSLAATQVYTHNTIEKLKNVHKNAHPKG